MKWLIRSVMESVCMVLNPEFTTQYYMTLNK